MDNNYNQQPVYQQETAIKPQAEDNSMKALIFGIIGLVLSESGLLGLIFSIIGLSQAKKYKQNFGELAGKAKVGNILSTLGLIFSILMMAFWVIYIIVIVVIAIAGAAASSGAYYY
ncbi:MAG: DUF4190 domain-containing protein [Clostridia bacterium]|nr:DUF4190 domain-containing protein [Clostridia bacterium]